MKRLRAIFRGIVDSRAALVVFGLLVGAVAIAAVAQFTDAFDSGDDSSPNSREEKTKQLVSEKERAKFPEDSVENAFFNYWSNLQFLDFNTAVDTFDPRLVEFVQSSRLEDSLKLQRGLFLKSKPEIIRVRKRGNRASVRYTIVDIDGQVTPNTITWVRDDGEWKILFDSLLDKILSFHAQNKAQKRINPDPKAPPAKQAIEAGDSASRLQRRFLEQLEDGGGQQDQAQQDQQNQQGQDEQDEQAPDTQGAQPGAPQGQ